MLTMLTVALLATAAAAAEPPAVFTPAYRTSSELQETLRRATQPLRDDVNRDVLLRRLAGDKAPDTVEAVLVMCDFADSLLLGRWGLVEGDFPPPAQTDRYYAAHDALYFEHLLRDVADYYDAVSGGAFTFSFTVHPDAVNLPHPMAWYGNHPDEGEQSVLLAADVVAALDGIVDFSQYDAVIVAHAGAGEETDILGDSPEQIFSTYLDPDDFAAAAEDGVIDQPYLPGAGFPAGEGVDRVLVLPETAQQDPIGSFNGGFGVLGTYCFEVGLHLGMLSLSDFTPSGRPDSQGIGQYGLMGYGLFVGLGFIPPQPCAFNRMLMGWLDPYDADIAAGATWSLAPAGDPAHPEACARVELTGQEYWLLEYRLQDPNGDRRFTFADDVNGNGVPDFVDADSENGDGTPTGKFDPATDYRERIVDAEWDFAMSENAARAIGELGAGSGIYVWHVDEGVIAEAFTAPSNLFNADPALKSVDLEEADGIQDLDSNTPSAWMLGGDDDSFRGEDHEEFGPATRPDTRTSRGAATGIRFSEFSSVVEDSHAYDVVVGEFVYPGYRYADAMTFRLERLGAASDAPLPYAQRTLPAGVDPDGSHLLVGSLDGVGADDEIIFAGAAGEVFVLDGELNEFLDHDGDPGTLEPFAVAERGGAPVPWRQPAALGDIDGDGSADIVLTGPAGLYAFGADGQPVREAEAGAVGLYAALGACPLPPVLVPADPAAPAVTPATPVWAVVVEQIDADKEAQLVFIGGPDGQRQRTVALGSGSVASPPVLWDEVLVVAIGDTSAAGDRLALVRLPELGVPEEPEVVERPLGGAPGPWPVTLARAPGSSADDPVVAAAVAYADGGGETVRFRSDRSAAGGVAWTDAAPVTGPLAPGGACVAQDLLLRVGQSGDPLYGWPVRPRGGFAASGATPLVARLVGTSSDLDQYLFSVDDGRIHARGAFGEEIPGWPLGGPARPTATPALGALGGELDDDLVALGVYPRIVGNADGGETLVTETLATITLWRDVAVAGAVWPMWGGSPWRNGSYETDGFVTTPAVAAGAGIVGGSHICYPSPLTEGPLKVRAQVRSESRVRAEVYNLAGERVAVSSWRDVPAVEPFTLEVDLAEAASGMYLCRLVAESAGGGRDNSVVQLAIVR